MVGNFRQTRWPRTSLGLFFRSRRGQSRKIESLLSVVEAEPETKAVKIGIEAEVGL